MNSWIYTICRRWICSEFSDSR